jgi:Na+-transporting NADH:ubiquinone oxidoreductase subunit NqrB
VHWRTLWDDWCTMAMHWRWRWFLFFHIFGLEVLAIVHVIVWVLPTGRYIVPALSHMLVLVVEIR